MADPIASRESITSAVLEKTPATGAAEHVEAAKKLRAQMEKEGDRSVLEDLKDKKPIDKGKVDRTIAGNIGVERKTDGTKALTTAEKSRKDAAETHADLTQEYLDKGYDKMADPTKQATLRTKVEQTLMAWPDGQALLTDPSLNSAQKQAIIEDILRNPAMSAQVRKGFEGALSAQVKDTVTEAKGKYDEAKKTEDEKAAELKRAKQEQTDTNDELKKHEVVGGAKGVKLQELEKITADLPAITSEIAQLSDERQDKADQLSNLKRKRSVELSKDPFANVSILDSAISQAKTDIRQLDRDIADRQQKLDRKKELEDEKRALEKKSKQLEEQQGQLDQEVKGLRQQRLDAQAALGAAKLDRVDDEQAFVDALNNVVPEATMQYITDQVTKAEQARDALLAEAKANAKDPAEVALLEQIGKRWDSPAKSVMGRETTKPNNVMIDSDLGTLVQQGPDTIIRIMLENGGMNPADIDAKMQDDSFMKNARAQVAENVIGKKMQKGKLSENEAAKIWAAPWGKDALTKAIDGNVQLKTKLKELRASGHVKGTNAQEIVEELREKKGLAGMTLAALLMLLFSPLAAVGVGTLALGGAVLGHAAN